MKDTSPYRVEDWFQGWDRAGRDDPPRWLGLGGIGAAVLVLSLVGSAVTSDAYDGRYPLILPMLFAGAGGVAAAVVAVHSRRRLRVAAAVLSVGLFRFAGFGAAKTYAAHYQWLCFTNHHDTCNNDGGDDNGPSRFGTWMVRHLAGGTSP
jgi:peptidoglycan/LPS O-acetylase OafA/YrhL